MRWGFHREFNPAINNSRAEKLESGMWSQAFRERRCLVPASAFYEWTGPAGSKQTHRFTRPDEEWIWIAGLWEEHPEHGPCYSMITTAANDQVASIHHRMPAVLSLDDATRFLSQPAIAPTPSTETLIITDCPNPLKRPRPEQGELF
jgi:putative SOS response-associated peptidase YedK